MLVSVLSHCVGCGACSILCPEVFDIRDNFAVINAHKISGNEDSCIDAAMFCPVGAVSIYE